MKAERVRQTAAKVMHFDNGDEVLVSYQTPVAGYVDGQYFRTDTQWSVTTSRHINDYLYKRNRASKDGVATVRQAAIDLLYELGRKS